MNAEFLTITPVHTFWQNVFQKCIFNQDDCGSTVHDKQHQGDGLTPKETARICNAREISHRSQDDLAKVMSLLETRSFIKLRLWCGQKGIKIHSRSSRQAPELPQDQECSE